MDATASPFSTASHLSPDAVRIIQTASLESGLEYFINLHTRLLPFSQDAPSNIVVSLAAENEGEDAPSTSLHAPATPTDVPAPSENDPTPHEA
ncbi:hypothetical protein Tco_1246701 [Tanacetum coccineum]